MPRYLVFFVGFIFAATAFDFVPQDCYEENCPETPDGDLPIITQPNPAVGWSVVETGTALDPLAAFGAFPLAEPRSIPPGGEYQDPERDGPHFGMDFNYPQHYYDGIDQPIYPIGPGIVTSVMPCPECWADADGRWGQVRSARPEHNYGFGAFVVIEHPYNEQVSFYSLYAHFREIDVHVGQRVDSSVQLGLLGQSGDAAAPHVHVEFRYGHPGGFWCANFHHREVMQRWLEMWYHTPNYLFYAKNHLPYTAILENWAADHPTDTGQ